MGFYHKLNDIMTHDAGGRGLRTPMPDLAAIATELRSAQRVLILTGFPVFAPDGTAHGETDGPLGAAEIACTLARLGAQVWLASDALSFPLICAAAAVYGEAHGVGVYYADDGCELRYEGEGSVSLLEIPSVHTEEFAQNFLRAEKITHFISIERPGRALCGHFSSMRGRVLDAHVADTDCFLRLFSGPSIAIGDGGNELGMGKYQQLIAQHVPLGDQIAAKLAADHVLSAGVSNWWGGGLAALLSFETGKDLLLSGETEEKALRAVLTAGGVDGYSGMPALSVDGLALEVHLGRRELLQKLLEESRKAALSPL